jgi:O-antigen/teichoic acid export membrane protein
LNRVQQSPIGKRLVSGTFWSVIGNGITKICTLIVTIAVANILGSQLFGEFGLVQSTANLFVEMLNAGIGLAATKYIAEFLFIDKQKTGRIISLSYILTLLFVLICGVVLFVV